MPSLHVRPRARKNTVSSVVVLLVLLSPVSEIVARPLAKCAARADREVA